CPLLQDLSAIDYGQRPERHTNEIQIWTIQVDTGLLRLLLPPQEGFRIVQPPRLAEHSMYLGDEVLSEGSPLELHRAYHYIPQSHDGISLTARGRVASGRSGQRARHSW